MTNLSPLAFAFLGDAYHTLYIRQMVLKSMHSPKNYHTLASKYCNASAQRQAIEKIYELLTSAEQEIAKSARNAHSKHKAKNYSEEDYKKATAFEALLGYLFANGQKERLNFLLDKIYQGENI